MRDLYCKLTDGCSGFFMKVFSEKNGYTKDVTLSDAFYTLMPACIYDEWINSGCECFALYSGMELKLNFNDSLLTLLKLCNDDEVTTLIVDILVKTNKSTV